MKKSLKVFTILSCICTVLSFLFFVLGPLFATIGGQAHYDVGGILSSVFQNGIPYIFSFADGKAIGGFILILISAILFVAYLISTIAKRNRKNVASLVLSFLVFVVALILVDAYLIDVSDVGAPRGGWSLIEYCASLLNSENVPMAMIVFSYVSISLIFLALIFVVITSFIGIFSKSEKANKIVEGSSLDDVTKEEAKPNDEIMQMLEEVNEESKTEDSAHNEEIKVEEDKKEDNPKENKEQEEVKQSHDAQQPFPPHPMVPPMPSGQPFIFQQFFGTTPMQQRFNDGQPSAPIFNQKPNEEVNKEPVKEENSQPKMSEEEIRSLIKDELKMSKRELDLKEIMHGELPTGHGDEIRHIVRDEVRMVANDDVMNSIFGYIRQIVHEELEKTGVKQTEVVNAPVEEIKPEVTKKNASPIIPAVPSGKPKIIRIPFYERCKVMSSDMRAHFNELKSLIMSYGVKSRVSNSGDTFRLHTKTYVKMTIAGNSLKLYFALDPKKYVNTTLPIADASDKGTYADIPLVFKVKSDLSLKRARGLIEDVMAVDNLKQTDIENKDWVQEIIINANDAKEDD